MITQLENPKTDSYYKLKEIVLAGYFPWFWMETTVPPILTDTPDRVQKSGSFFSHTFLRRPCENTGIRYPNSNSNFINTFSQFIEDLIKPDVNDIDIKCIYRMNANLTLPLKGSSTSPIHVDHEYPHKNMLIYLTDAGGETVCNGESHDPKEDDIIIFGGEDHFHYYPQEKRRITLVMTYL